MKFIVLFEDNPGVGVDVRRAHMPEHLAFLERNTKQVQAAGPLKTTCGEGAGGIWIVNAAEHGEVDKLIKEDPFWPTGLRKSVRILEWTQVFADGTTLMPPK